MTYTEAQIRTEALVELNQSKIGKLTTTQLIELLEDRLAPTGKDAEMAEGRGDTYFSQKVRNLVSHRDQGPGLSRRGLAIYDADEESWTITAAGRAKVA
ncbi:hypothetical protein [uncultured Roseobacter sp.]|uniref:hypothetical protein n=1 Tax=uncultured Roseobacter sp. TaxID=114847 RepID=UPI002610320F|nr:hypothetical protein [uncultured Roseobacter sp.]